MTRGPASSLPEVFTHADARAKGISDRQLYKWRDSGIVEHLARGIYTRPGLEADPDLVEVSVRAPDAILCLTTALARHDLVDDIPPTIDVALPRRHRQPRTTAPVTWHRFDDDTFDIGRTPLDVVTGHTIGLYSPERSILDAIRLRHLYGQDQAIGALRRWLRQPASQPSHLLRLARHFPQAEPSLRQALTILL